MTEPVAPAAEPLAGTRRSGKHALWPVIERMAHLAVAFIVSIVVARTLGKEDLGSLAIGLFLLLVGSVINPAVQSHIRDLIAKPQESGRYFAASATSVAIINSAFYLVLAGFVCSSLGLDSTTGLVILIVVGSALLRPFNVVDAWFKKELQSKVAVQIRLVGLLVTGAARVARPCWASASSWSPGPT